MIDEDVESAKEALVKAELWPLVDALLGTFTLEQVLDDIRTPPRLVMLRDEIWAHAYDIRNGAGRRLYSLPELGRLFNRDHTSILTGIRRHHAALKRSTNGRATVP